jgi:cytochrome b
MQPLNTQPPSNAQTKLWALPIRIFHWLLVGIFVTSYLSSEWESLVHIYSGYGLIVLLLFRLLWGIWGGRQSRFSAFPLQRTALVNHFNALRRGRAESQLGHNPLGALMVVAMLLALSGIAATGLALSIEEQKGPIAHWWSETATDTAENKHSPLDLSASTDQPLSAQKQAPKANPPQPDEHELKENHEHEEEWLEEFHELFVNLMIVLIVLHISGVLVSSRLEKVNYIKRITTGETIE